MPSAVDTVTALTEPRAPKLAYTQVPETQYDLDWADLVTLDLAKFDQPGGKQALAQQLFEALQTIGFFYIVNFGLGQEEVDRQFAIGKAVFDLPTEKKLSYRADLENGGYNGYKPLGLREVKPGIFDNTEIFNIPKFIPAFERRQPEVINANRAEIEQFARHIHHNIVQKLLTLFAIVLELDDENYFLNSHRYDEKSDCHLRYMKYHRRSTVENEALENVCMCNFISSYIQYPAKSLEYASLMQQHEGCEERHILATTIDTHVHKLAHLKISLVVEDFIIDMSPGVKGHTDFGSLTLLFRQPVAALQVRTPEGGWKWVKPFPGSITVNVADALEMLTNGFLKSSIHRVVVPPPDQRDADRLGVLYFVRPEDNLELRPVQSPVLERLGYDKVREDVVGITAGEWVKARVRAGVNRNGQVRSEISEQEIIGGRKAKYYD